MTAQAGANLDGESAKVLVVDDEKHIRDIMTRYLQRAGTFEVVQASNGPEAILVGAEEKPNFVLLDFNLPGMNGEEIARDMRERVPGVFIIACSGSVVSKPYWADSFLEKSKLGEVAVLLNGLARG